MAAEKPDTRKLKTEAVEAVAAGRLKRAVECYAALSVLEPREGAWPHKLGEVLGKLDRREDALAAFARAAELYARSGFLLKAIAVCKVLLALDPAHTTTQARLVELHAEQLRGARRVIGRPPSAAAAPAPAAPANPPVAAAPVPLDQLPVVEMLPGSKPALELPSGARVDVGAGGGAWEMSIDIEPDAEPPEPAPAPAPAPGPALEPAPMVESAAAPAEPAPQSESTSDTEPDGGADPLAVLKRTPLFSALDEFRLGLLIERVRLVHLEAGQVLFTQGDPGDCLYVIAEGGVIVRTEPDQLGQGRELARLGEGAFFGEIALVTDQPRTATVEAAVPTDLLAVDRLAVTALIHTAPEPLRVLLRFLRERLVDTLVETSELFSHLPPDERPGLAARFKFLDVSRGTDMVRQGARTPGLFVLLAGRASALREEQQLAELSPGDVFGEMSLLTRQPAVATVRASSRCFVLELPRADFQDVIMTHPQVLEHVNALAEERARILARSPNGGHGPEEHLEMF